MTDVKLGQLAPKDAERDAIHIAVAPVHAQSKLKPGWRVAVTNEGTAYAVDEGGVGIVDPFLRKPVLEGERFYVFLFPNTIVGLRHDWSHPAFPRQGNSVQESVIYLQNVAQRIGTSYDKLLRAATAYAQYGEYTYDNSEDYKDFRDWDEFWVHFEKVTGIYPEDTYGPYTCSC